ncbi:MAG TPA: hypothetical protein VGM03_15985, partial [Phycisphaerae bacterium]
MEATNRYSLVFVVGLSCLFAASTWCGCKERSDGRSGDDGRPRLAVITPHDERIQKAFSEGFNAARARAGQPPVTFEWNIQGTNEAVKFIIGEFSAAARQGRDTGTNYDMLFGGGRPAMDALKKAGCTQAVQVSPDILAGIPKTLGGIALYDPDGHWFGCVLAAFG